MKINKILNKPKIIAVVGDVNSGKSMLLYHIIETAKKEHFFNLYYYGLRKDIQGIRIYSVAEMETITNSIILIDELSSLFDLDNRKAKRSIENTLRLINHNNNILILSGVPENFKKFIAAKINEAFFKKVSIGDFINGSTLKNIVTSYKGNERGSEILNVKTNKTLYYDGTHYQVVNVPYYKSYDSKANNEHILKKRAKNVSNFVL